MSKHVKRTVCALLVVVSIPAVISALTIDEVKAQLESILARVVALRAELERRSSVGPSTTEIPAGLPCLSIARTLSFSSRGDDVRELQNFLIKARMLEAGNDTGYFGPLTEAAVKEWQAVQNIVSSGDAASTGYGVVGPKTRASILASCSRGIEPQARTCPQSSELPPLSGCTGSWERGFDASGCFTGYQCVLPAVSVASTTSAPLPPSVAVIAPTVGSIVTGGNTLTISWRSTSAAPRAVVSLTLLDLEGGVIGTIADNLTHTGSFAWRVPREESECSIGESAFDCIARIARCEGNTSLCGVLPGTYNILATLSNAASTTSAPFEIAGTSVSGLLQALVGAPTLSPLEPAAVGEPALTGTSTQAGTQEGGICAHGGATYQEGETLSVPCEAGNCPSSGTGFITGACSSGGQWCIPYTSYCALILTRIDVSAYEGGGAAPIGSGHSVNCPREGWRIYFTCPSGGSCRSGYHICRGGAWAYDSDQSVQI